MVFFLNIVYERLFAFPGLTPSGYYGGMIFAESAEDVLGFYLVHFLPAPVRFSRSDTQWLLWRDDPR